MALTTDIVAYYKLDGNANDAAGSNDGTINGATYTASGKINGCYDFDGSNDYITGNIGISSRSGYTIACWAKLDSLAGGIIMIRSTTNDKASFGFDESGGYLRARHRSSAQVFNSCLSDNEIVVDTRYHMVQTWDGTTVKMYLDGVLQDDTITISNYAPISGNFVIGSSYNSGSPTDYHNGLIDEPAFRTRALTSTEVSELYNSGDGFQYPFSTGTYKIYLGATQLSSLKLGSTDIQKAYLGDIEVFSK